MDTDAGYETASELQDDVTKLISTIKPLQAQHQKLSDGLSTAHKQFELCRAKEKFRLGHRWRKLQCALEERLTLYREYEAVQLKRKRNATEAKKGTAQENSTIA